MDLRTRVLQSQMPDPDDAPAWINDELHAGNPYLHGFYAPVMTEVTADDLEVEGTIPADMYGAYYRQSPNPMFRPKFDHHFFDGDGMVYGIYFRDGKVSFSRKYVKTEVLMDDINGVTTTRNGMMAEFDLRDAEARGYEEVRNPDYVRDTANTTLNIHNGKLITGWYNAGAVYELDPVTLDTKGLQDFGGSLRTTLNAHPKTDMRTGELIGYDYADFESFYTYYVWDKHGALKHVARIDLPGPRLPHDITITENYSLLHDWPFFHDPDMLKSIGRRVVTFKPDMPSRIGVIPRYGTQDQVKWFEFKPGYVLHMVNAWEEGDWIIMDGCMQPDPRIKRDPAEGPLASMLAYMRVKSHLYRWRMNVRTGETSEESLDDLNVEFCLPDVDLYGQKTRYSYHQHIPLEAKTLIFTDLVKYDHETMKREMVSYGDGWLGSESAFARSTHGGAEDNGYVVTICTNLETYASECWVYAAQDITAGPIAKVKLPSRCGPGFHATWVQGEHIWG